MMNGFLVFKSFEHSLQYFGEEVGGRGAGDDLFLIVVLKEKGLVAQDDKKTIIIIFGQWLFIAIFSLSKFFFNTSIKFALTWLCTRQCVLIYFCPQMQQYIHILSDLVIIIRSIPILFSWAIYYIFLSMVFKKN